MKFIVGSVKLVLGIFLSLFLLGLVGAAATNYFMLRLTTPPPRPTFANDTPETLGSAQANAAPAAEAAPPESPAAPPAEPATEALEPGTYKARVTQSIGLILRDQPDPEAAQIGGIEYNREVIVLSESEDKRWLRVRLSDGSEGWVKAGNTERIN